MMTGASLNRGSAPLACVLIALVAVLAYANTFVGEFVWDDVSSILIHEDVKDPNRVARLFQEDQHEYGRGEGNFYRPLLSLTFMIDYQLASMGRSPADLDGIPRVSPFVFHFSSVMWHIAAAIGFFFVLRVFHAPYFVQWAAAAVYAVHPLHTEAVAYISGRGDSMAAAFLFAGVAVAAGLPAARDGVIFRSLIAALCVLLASLSKESGMMTLPLLIWTACCLGSVARPKKGEPSLAARFAPVGAGLFALIVYFVVRRNVITGGGESTTQAASIGQRLVESLQSLMVYARLIVAPANLHMERTLAGVPTWYAAVGGVIVVVLIALLVWSWRRRDERIAMACGLFLIAWFPISGIIPLNAPLAEHWMYVPLAGVLWIVAEGIHRASQAWGRPLAAPVFAGIAVIAFLPATVERNADWRDNVTLFEATLEDNPNTLRVRQNLAIVHEDDGSLQAALRGYRNLAAYYDRNRVEGAAPSLEELEIHLSLGKIYLDTGRAEASMGHFDRVLDVSDDPRFKEYTIEAVRGMARAFVDQGDINGAERFLLGWVQRDADIAPVAWELLGGRGLAFQQRR